MKKNWQVRHGDVQLIRIDEIPGEAKSLGKRKELAYGEVTGHAHRVDVGELFEDKNGGLFLNVEKLSRLTHEEHKEIQIHPGKFKIVIKRQYSPDGWQKVQD